MRRLLTASVVIRVLLWSTTSLTAQASSILLTRTFSTNLVKGEYVDEAEEIQINKNPEVQESVDDEPIDGAEEIITDPDEIEKPEPLDEQEPQESDEHTDVSTPTNIESVVDEEAGELEEPTQSEELVDEQLDAPENTGDSIEPEVETPIDSEDIGETEEENETEVQSTQ